MWLYVVNWQGKKELMTGANKEENEGQGTGSSGSSMSSHDSAARSRCGMHEERKIIQRCEVV